jgi:hypothetical protein
VSALERLADTLRAEGGLLGDAVRHQDGNPLVPEGSRAFAVEAIREGHLLHHATSRLLDTSDPDLALLAGDRLYALGLAALAAAGDLEAVRVMAEVIAGAAAALGEGDEAAAEAAWEQGLHALAS